MKKLIVLCIVFVSGHLNAEWKKPNQDPSLGTWASVIVTPQLRFTLEGRYIYRSTNQGQSWQKDSLDLQISNYYILNKSMQFSDENNVFIFYVLQEHISNKITGHLFKTSDQGNTWVEIPLNEQVDNSSILYMANGQWFIISRDHISFSEDEGKLWHELQASFPEPVILDLKVASENLWYLVTNNKEENMPAIYSSSNHGENWQLMGKIDFRKDSFSMQIIFHGDLQVKEENIYLALNIYYPSCGYYYDHSFLYHLQKNIHAWDLSVMSETRLQPISRIFFTSDDTAYMMSGNAIYKTIDGGKTWFTTYNLNYEDGHFTDLAVIDGILTASTNKGIVVINENSNDDINLSVKNTKPSMEILVYPNPAGDQLNIRLPEISANCDYSLMNEAGQTVLNSSCQNCSLIEINTSGLASGIYIYTIHSGSTKTRGKIILR